METGRRFGNQVGDPLRYQPRDVRGNVTAQGFHARGFNPTGALAGLVLAHLDAKRVGAFSADPFFIPARTRRRVWLDFLLAGKSNADEDVTRYLRSIPGDKVLLEWTRNGTGQSSFRVYYTAGIGSTPQRRLTEYRDHQRKRDTTSTAAEFEHLVQGLAAGGHSFQLRPTDRAGNEKTGCPVLTTTLAPWPMPPTGVAVHAFVRTTGLVTLKWAKASDHIPTSTYQLFRNSGGDGKVRYATAIKSVATAFNLTGSPSKVYATFSLPSTGAAAKGAWLAGVRHTKGGIQEDNVSALARFVLGSSGGYSAGGYPHPPGYLMAKATAGGRVVVRIKHDKAGEENAALRFRVYRSPGGVSTVALGTAIATITRLGGRYFEGSASVGPLTHGLQYRFTVRSEATGSVREVNTAVATAVADAQGPARCPTAVSLTKVIG